MIFRNFLIVISLLTATNAKSFGLETGIIFKGRGTVKTQEHTNAYPIIKSIVSSVQDKQGFGLGDTNLGNGFHWFRLYPNMIVGVDTSAQKLLGTWPLTRWSHLNPPREIIASLNNFSIKDFKSEIAHVPNQRAAGCLAQSPLRYGDVELDGKSELVLFLNGELIIFSPDYQRTVFSSFWQADDWERESTEYNGKPSPESSITYQFASAELALNDLPYKAMRAYSKIYEGSFDQDTHADILVWEKVYESNNINEVPGFKLLRSTLKHYERDLTAQAATPEGITGEYLPQITDDATIKGWLSAKNLTWQKGYPSLSECAGDAGQLIPEMHDPLLNDPEVLQ